MEQAIDKTDIEGQLETIFRKIFTAYRNRKSYKHFQEVTKDMKPQSCFVKYGWRAGEYFYVACKFKKNGSSDIIKEIVKGLENKIENLYFLYGLYPNILEFDPAYSIDEVDYLSLTFKFLKK